MTKNKQIDFLIESARAGKGAHAYLFAGGGGDDKKNTALALAREITGALESALAFNPDIMMVQVEEGESGISIGQIREIKKFLSLTPYAGKGRSVIVSEFERMKSEASSAILKILEEPPAGSALILISDYPAMILPTILSRVQKISFSSAGAAIPADIDKRKEMFYALTTLIFANTYEKLNKIEDLCKGDDSADVFEYWLSFFRDLGCLAAGCDEYIANSFYAKEMKETLAQRRYSSVEISKIISEILHWSYIGKTTNTNKRLILENLALGF